MNLHKKFLPVYDFNEVHSLRVKASSSDVFNSILTLNFRKSVVIRFLFALRGIGGSARSGMSEAAKMGFVLLEKSDHEVILGLVGQFWKPSGNIQFLTPVEFVSFDEKDFLKATWNFEVNGLHDNLCEVITETRIACLGKSAKRKFSWYWFFIKPFSGLIRMEMLKAIRRQAENRN